MHVEENSTLTFAGDSAEEFGSLETSGADSDSEETDSDSEEEALDRISTSISLNADLDRTSSAFVLDIDDKRVQAMWQLELLNHNIIFGAKIILIENILIAAETLHQAILHFRGKSHWTLVWPFVGSLSLEAVVLSWCIWHPNVRLYLLVLVFDSCMSVIAADFRLLDVTAPANTGVQYLYICMTYTILQTMYFPSLNSLAIVALTRILFIGLCVGYSLSACASEFVSWDEFIIARFADFGVGMFAMLTVYVIALRQKWRLQRSQYNQARLEVKQRCLCSKMYNVFSYMVPSFLVTRLLSSPDVVIADRVDKVSVLFILFLDFDRVASTTTPLELLYMLNRSFKKLDDVCERHSVTKIETIGEEYVCAVGVSPSDRMNQQLHGHEDNLARLFKLALAVQEIHRQSNSDFAVKMGIHTGPVVAGIVGRRLPRFRLFGDTINTAARMMQKGLPGEVQFGDATYQEMPNWATAEHRGWIDMKGKGEVMTYLLRDYVKEDDHFAPMTQQSPNRSLAPMTHQSSNRSRAPVTNQSSSRSPASSKKTTLASHRFLNDVDRTSTTPKMLLHEGLMQELMFKRFKYEEDSDEDIASEDLLVHRLTRRQTIKPPERGVRDFCGLCTWHRWASSEFVEEEDDDFINWFHEYYTCPKLGRELYKQLVFIGFFSFCITFYALFRIKSLSSPAAVGNGFLMLKCYLALRAAALLLVLGLMIVADRGWLAKSTMRVQFGMAFLRGAVSILIFSSYGLLWRMVTEVVSIPPTLGCNRFQLLGISRNLILLVFFLEICYTMTKDKSLLVPRFCEVVVTLAVIYSLGRFVFKVDGVLLNTLLVLFIFNMFRYMFMEINLRGRFTATRKMDCLLERIEDVLSRMMPEMVIERIRETHQYQSHFYESATIAQSDLCGFTALASKREPEEIVQFISQLFDIFDDLSDKYSIYKIETVGDAYIAGQADPPLTKDNLPLSVVLFGLEMMEATLHWSEHRGELISCRVGIHSGSCYGGMVGNSMQRYHLFGDLTSKLELLESTAPTGGVQLSRACREAVERQTSQNRAQASALPIEFELRTDDVLKTSKGEIHSYDEVGGRTFLVRRKT